MSQFQTIVPWYICRAGVFPSEINIFFFCSSAITCRRMCLKGLQSVYNIVRLPIKTKFKHQPRIKQTRMDRSLLFVFSYFDLKYSDVTNFRRFLLLQRFLVRYLNQKRLQ